MLISEYLFLPARLIGRTINISTPGTMRPSQFGDEPNVTISTDIDLLQSQVLQDQRFLVYPQYKETYQWVVRIDVDARFANETKNVVRYLSGLQKLSYNVSGSLDNREKIEGDDYAIEDLSKKQPEESAHGLHWQMYLFSKNKPDLKGLSINLGPLRMTVPLTNLNWKLVKATFGPGGNVVPDFCCKEESSWNASAAKISIALPAPSWVVMYSARVLNETSGSGTILEAVIQNLSNSTYSVNELVVDAWSPYPGPRCKPPPQWYNATLDWGAITKGDPGASLQFNGHKVAVSTKYTNGNCATDYHFKAFMPIALDLAPGTSERVYLAISQIPPFEGNLGRPSSISDFKYIQISLNPSDLVFPKDLAVGR